MRSRFASQALGRTYKRGCAAASTDKAMHSAWRCARHAAILNGLTCTEHYISQLPACKLILAADVANTMSAAAWRANLSARKRCCALPQSRAIQSPP